MFDIHQSLADAESGEFDDERLSDYMDGLLEDFAQAPEGKECLGDQSWPGWAEVFLRYCFDYVGSSVPKMTTGDVNEVLFDLFPRKVSTGPESAAEIIAELRAFWKYLGRQFGLSAAPKIVALLNDNAVTKLEAELANPRNYGMAKSMFMMGQQAGFDMTTQEGMDTFMHFYSSQLLNGPASREADEGFLGFRFLPAANESRKDQRKKKKQQRQARRRNRR